MAWSSSWRTNALSLSAPAALVGTPDVDPDGTPAAADKDPDADLDEIPDADLDEIPDADLDEIPDADPVDADAVALLCQAQPDRNRNMICQEYRPSELVAIESAHHPAREGSMCSPCCRGIRLLSTTALSLLEHTLSGLIAKA